MLSQLGARVQHALRAFTPDDQKALTKTARTYPKSAVYDIEELLTTLGTGEALVTVLSERGAPTPVAWTRIRAPRSLMAAIGEPAVTEAAQGSPLWPKYGTPIDRESAHEKLAARTGATNAPATPPAEPVPPQQAPQEAPPQAPPPAEDEGPAVPRAIARPLVLGGRRGLRRRLLRGLLGGTGSAGGVARAFVAPVPRREPLVGPLAVDGRAVLRPPRRAAGPPR